MSDQPGPVRSYQRIFSPDRRIYQIEGHPLPVPGGVPLRWLGYAVATVLAVIVISARSPGLTALVVAGAGLAGLVAGGRRAGALAATAALAAVTVFGVLLGVLDWPLRLLILPGLAATLATQATPDGRPAHRFVASWLAVRLRGRRSLGRPLPASGADRLVHGQVWVSPDHHAPGASTRASARSGDGALRRPDGRSSAAVAGARAARPSGQRAAPRQARRRRRRLPGARVGRAAGAASMTAFALRYARGNLLLGRGGERVALYRLRTLSYPFLPVAGKWALLHRLERLAYVVGADFSLWRVNRAFPADRYVEDTAGLLDPRGQDQQAWRTYLEGQRAALERLASHVPEVYLAVSLAEAPAAGFGSGLLRSVDRARRRLEDVIGVAGAQPISGSELEALAISEQRVFERLRGVVGCERASTRELEWLLRRAACRGVTEPALDPFWTPDALIVEAGEGRVAYEPLEHDLLSCVNAAMTEPTAGAARLVVESEAGTSHQALLCLGALADEPVFPGGQAELLFAPLEGVEFPVDAVLHARWLGNRDALGQVRKRITDVEQVYRDQAEGSRHGPGWLAEEDRVLAREYEAILQGSAHPPMLYAALSLAIGAPDDGTLERRVAALQDQYGELVLHRPRGLQEQLWFDHLPQPGGAGVRDYTAQMTVEQFGALMPLGSQHVGATRGVYLGWTPGGGGRPVRYDVTAPSREARTSAVLLAGTLGSGKTVAAQAIALGGERRGSLVVDFDPKPDHGFDEVPQLEGRVEVLELSGAEAHRGKLDPLAIGLEDLREELASSYYLDLLREPPPSWENAIQRAVREVVRQRGRSSLQVIDQLKAMESDAAREAADALEVVADFGLARLGFGTDTGLERGSAAAVTTIRTPGLTLPDPRASRETYTRSERVSVATLALVAAYALRLVASDRSRHKVVLLDEAWFLLASPQGRTVINRLVRLGRAFNATVLLATQRLEDLGDLSDLVGTYLTFGQESDTEAGRALELLGLDPTDRALIARLREFRRGRCLMRDLDGRVGEVQVDLADPALLQAFDTTPKQAAG